MAQEVLPTSVSVPHTTSRRGTPGWPHENLRETLDEIDDVSNVSANFDIDDEVLARLDS